MRDFILNLPDDFIDFECEVQSKGYFGNVELIFESEIYFISFYDRERFRQEIDDGIKSEGLFLCVNVIILENVSKSTMIASIEKMINNSEIKWLKKF